MKTAKTPGRLSEKRTEAVKISLTPTSYEKLLLVAEAFGMAPSQIAAIAVAEYTAKQAISLQAAETGTQKMIDSMAPHMADLFQSIADKEGK